MVQYTQNSTMFTTMYRGKTVKVILEFPKQPDKEAEQEFISRLKEIYLSKIMMSARSMEEGDKTHE